MIKKIDHIGIAVNNLDDAKQTFGNLFQITNFETDYVESQEVNVASFYIGEVKIELLAPTSNTSPIYKYLQRKGEGIHHIAFESSDINQELKRSEELGFELINETPLDGAHNMLVAFLHPKSTNKVLTEFCQRKENA